MRCAVALRVAASKSRPKQTATFTHMVESEGHSDS